MPETDIVFLVKSKDGKKIRLTNAQWKHIKFRHPEMANMFKDMEDAIRNPTAVRRHSESIIKFYKFIKNKKEYIMVAVRILNGYGFIVTSYFTVKIQKE